MSKSIAAAQQSAQNATTKVRVDEEKGAKSFHHDDAQHAIDALFKCCVV